MTRCLFHSKMTFNFGPRPRSIAFSSSYISLHTVEVIPLTQFLQRTYPKLNNLKGSSLVSAMRILQHWNNVSKKILSCLGSMRWHTVLHEHRTIPPRIKSGRGVWLGELPKFVDFPLIFLKPLKLAASKFVCSWDLPKPIVKSHRKRKLKKESVSSYRVQFLSLLNYVYIKIEL